LVIVYAPQGSNLRRVDFSCRWREELATASIVVSNWSSTSFDLGVFVYQLVEQIATSEAKLGWRW
jgi:hypothetical protein